jgi:flagellar motility protein MotE (MotC chaperone)
MADFPDWKTKELWMKQVERRLYEIGSMTKGGVLIQADRISDLLQQLDELRAALKQIDELRQELKRIAERQDKIADYVKQHVKKETDNRPT